MKTPRVIFTEKDMERTIARLAKEIVSDGTENVVLVGIKSRGVPLAEAIGDRITSIQGSALPIGHLDINLYRDDLSEVDHKPVVRLTELPFDVNGKGIILVDDVLYTGRTIRAAMDALVDYGRPRFIRLAVIIDRGWREFPIQADYIGKELKTKQGENVKVMIKDIDQESKVLVRGEP